MFKVSELMAEVFSLFFRPNIILLVSLCVSEIYLLKKKPKTITLLSFRLLCLNLDNFEASPTALVAPQIMVI